jgi:chemotaxis protein methyltransferase CheR
MKLVENRVSKRLESLYLKSYEDYIKIISSEKGKDELTHLFDAITINETYFFRAENQFAALERVIIPELVRERKNAPIRIWSAAASSGEEPYSIAMIVEEKLKKRFPEVTFEIFASDISTKMIEKAKTGLYSEYSVRNIPSEYFANYFTKFGDMYKISSKIKQMVEFENINLMDSLEIGKLQKFDIIFCANVLMYFDNSSKEKVVSYLYNKLNVGGCLFVGYSESLHSVSKSFRLVHFPKAMGYKKEYF